MADFPLPTAPAISLAGAWQAAETDGPTRAELTLPGDILSGLVEAGIEPDPFFGQNEYAAREVAHKTWRVARSVEISAADLAAAGNWYLDLSYVDTLTTITVNDQVVCRTDNCFMRYRPDVSDALRPGENLIEIEFAPSPSAANARAAAQPFPIPYSTDNCPIPNVNMLRKPQCHYGWDWNIALAPVGIYGDISLNGMQGARIDHLVVVSQEIAANSARVTVAVEVCCTQPGNYPLVLRLADQTQQAMLDLTPGTNRHQAQFEIEDPDLWWPAGHGNQPLYALSAEIAGHQVSRNIGIREISLSTAPDTVGSEFALIVNGRRIFCRGANWIPASALPSQINRQKVANLLDSACAAHMNMIRVWGGGFYEPDWFYDLCDERGLLVWQDFMFSCSLYPATDTFLGSVDQEVRYQARRLSGHPCIALWCGDNELIGALNWFEESRADRDRYLVNYDRLNRSIEQALTQELPNAVWWPSSPSPGPLSFGDAWHDDRAGDMHFWDVWHEGKSFDHYRSVRPRFCSEFGFQSFPSMNEIDRFTAPEDRNISSPVMESHQKNAGGNARITETLFRYFRFPRDFEQFVYLSQIQQGLAMRTAIDFWRAQKPHCMGTLYWQLNDTWPCASWSGLNSSGEWKALHYMARHFYQPVSICAYPDGEHILLQAVNDTPAAVTLDLTLSFYDACGELFAGGLPFRAEVDTDAAVNVARLLADNWQGAALLRYEFAASDGAKGAGHLCLSSYKSLTLPSAGLAMQAVAHSETVEITVSAEKLALYVMLTTTVPGRFSDGCFDLGAGERRKIIFRPDDPADIAAAQAGLQLYDLTSSHTPPTKDLHL